LWLRELYHACRAKPGRDFLQACSDEFAEVQVNAAYRTALSRN
jgi:hypothetical protein